MKDKRRKRPFTRQTWIDAGLRTLLQEGHRGLTVEHLARTLGVSKGSFYWHFENRDDLILSVIEQWDHEQTGPPRDAASASKTRPEDRLRHLMESISLGTWPRYEVAIRAWALTDARVAAAVRRVDKRRLAFVGSLFREMGFRGNELEMRTRLFVCFHHGEYAFLARESKARARQLLKLRHKLLVLR